MHSRATDRRSASKCQGKCPDQTLDQAFGLSEVLVAVSTSRLSCKSAGKTRTLMPVWDSSGESRLRTVLHLVRFNSSYDIRDFCDDRALNSLHFLHCTSAGFCVHLCCIATPVGSSSPTMATTRGPCSTTLATRTSSTRSGTPKWRPTDSRTFGGIDDGGAGSIAP